ncbi:hypothetical protein X738_18800 [Mesorhizobium sp. LNHC209A00]|nr:hypothetical protein X738_18800 [Mesorhizobium sp. LNHC209A00]
MCFVIRRAIRGSSHQVQPFPNTLVYDGARWHHEREQFLYFTLAVAQSRLFREQLSKCGRNVGDRIWLCLSLLLVMIGGDSSIDLFQVGPPFVECRREAILLYGGCRSLVDIFGQLQDAWSVESIELELTKWAASKG